MRQLIDADFPGLWRQVDAGLSTSATPLLEDNSTPGTLIFVGDTGGSKTTVLGFFSGHEWTYTSDDFTPAAFVSQASNVSPNRLEQIDLLPRIKHKVLITPDLAPIFRGREDELFARFKIITRVLDGQGLWTDKGTHGRRGYGGDYLFAWLGATTPIEDRGFRVMEQLGSRLFFYDIGDTSVTCEQLVEAHEGDSYRQRVQRCREMVHDFLARLFGTNGGVRGVVWDSSADDRALLESLARWAQVLSAMRSQPPKEPDPKRPGSSEYIPPRTERPWRAEAVLYNLARGHALVHGRRHLTVDDLPLVVDRHQEARNTRPAHCRWIAKAR